MLLPRDTKGQCLGWTVCIPESVDLRFIAVQLQRMDKRIEGLEASMNERFQRVEAEIARAQADISETKAIAREVVSGSPSSKSGLPPWSTLKQTRLHR